MKSPFVILLAIVVLVGICIGVATIILIGPTNQDDDADTISIASESDLPTPSTRNEAVQTQVGTTERQPAVVVVSTSVTTEESSSDELAPKIQERIESGEAVVVITAEASGRGGFRGGGPGFGGGDDNPNVQAIQEAIQSNPEIQELFQKVQTGNISQADQERLRELILAEAGIEAPGAGQGGGFGTPPIQGIISTIDGSTLIIDHADDSGLSTDAQITDNTNITVINELTPADLTEGANVAGTVQRGEGGRIFIVNLTILPEQQEQGFGSGFRGLFGGAFGAGGDATSLSNINGTISEINDQTISVETTQGTLRLTADDESTIVSTSSGTVGDIMEGMAVIAFGGSQDNTPIQPRNLIVGPDALLQVNQDQ